MIRNIFFSPLPELALFFGMTSVETGGSGVLVGGDGGGVVLLLPFCLSSQRVTELCALPYMARHKGLKLSSGCIRKLHCRGSLCINSETHIS